MRVSFVLSGVALTGLQLALSVLGDTPSKSNEMEKRSPTWGHYYGLGKGYYGKGCGGKYLYKRTLHKGYHGKGRGRCRCDDGYYGKGYGYGGYGGYWGKKYHHGLMAPDQANGPAPSGPGPQAQAASLTSPDASAPPMSGTSTSAPANLIESKDVSNSTASPASSNSTKVSSLTENTSSDKAPAKAEDSNAAPPPNPQKLTDNDAQGLSKRTWGHWGWGHKGYYDGYYGGCGCGCY